MEVGKWVNHLGAEQRAQVGGAGQAAMVMDPIGSEIWVKSLQDSQQA